MSIITEENVKISENEIDELFKKYRETGDISIRNTLVMNYSYIARSAATQLRGLALGYAQIEDMVNQGVITLIDCIDKFDESKGIKFESYAFMRVRGGIIDLIRKQDWVPRRVRAATKEIANAKSILFNELKREPTETEIADKLKISVDKLRQYNYEAASSVIFSFEELIQNVNQMGYLLDSATSDYSTPEKQFLKNELKEKLIEAISELNERERLVVTLYYFENLNLNEISQVLDVSVQRVSQISIKAISKIKSAMIDYIS